MPLIVLNAGEYNSLTKYDEETRERTRIATQKLAGEPADLAPGGKEIIVQGVGHEIHGAKPQVVIDAFKEIYSKNTGEKYGHIRIIIVVCDIHFHQIKRGMPK